MNFLPLTATGINYSHRYLILLQAMPYMLQHSFQPQAWETQSITLGHSFNLRHLTVSLPYKASNEVPLEGGREIPEWSNGFSTHLAHLF